MTGLRAVRIAVAAVKRTAIVVKTKVFLLLDFNLIEFILIVIN